MEAIGYQMSRARPEKPKSITLCSAEKGSDRETTPLMAENEVRRRNQDKTWKNFYRMEMARRLNVWRDKVVEIDFACQKNKKKILFLLSFHYQKK